MIKLIDVQNHIVKALSDRFTDHSIYREGNQKKHRLPAFYVSVRPLTTTARARYENELVNVDIQYLSEKGTNQENLKMMDKLSDLFSLSLRVYDRRLHIPELTMTESDGVLTVGFTLNYNTDIKARRYESDLGYGEGKTRLMKELEYEKGDV